MKNIIEQIGELDWDYNRVLFSGSYGDEPVTVARLKQLAADHTRLELRVKELENREPILSISQETQDELDYESEWGHEVYFVGDGPSWVIRQDAPTFEEWKNEHRRDEKED